MNTKNVINVRLWRRLVAILYESLLLLAVIFIAALIVQPWVRGQPNLLYIAYLVCVSFTYFTWQWVHGGQTLALRTWQMQIKTIDGTPLTWKQASIRFFVAILSWSALGIGFFWAAFDKQHRTWHDIAAKTALVKLYI